MLSTGFGGAETGKIRIGDAVAVFAQGTDRPLRDGWRSAHGGGSDRSERPKWGRVAVFQQQPMKRRSDSLPRPADTRINYQDYDTVPLFRPGPCL